MTDTTPGRPRRFAALAPLAPLARRWPTALAVGATALNMLGGDPGDAAVGGFGEALLLLPLLYLIVTQIGRPGATWPVLGALVAGMVALRALDVAAPSTVLVAIALAALVWGAISGTPHGRGVFGVQAAGMLVFGALALTGLAVDPELGRYLVAAGWFGHGIWDFVHLKRGAVVSRTFAEWCGVIDILVAAQLLLLP
ncbi:hypothetical protein CLV63_102204 [Murinocardiopsis flavida]|uniref:Uncharacterized protein n=1 Tax=Murinocardiopsis flavida TaxID=645275 RepID=A0A2P8DS90_9ACTN|nr:hypothetical protein [Murinocardiopsis flavida]PSL00078.1 hypothetical protein CLV63_102204 [Murinocardiopsis flavida]